MLFPRKLRGPIDTRDTRKEVLEKSALMIDNPSATIVPLPTELRYGVLVRHLIAEIRPGLHDRGPQVIAQGRADS